jgi:superfamily II RNA helicase
MTTDELEKLLAQQPVGRLHRLARGRIYRHFRLGKRRLIEALLRHSADNRAGLESDLATLMQEGSGPQPPGNLRRQSGAAHSRPKRTDQAAPRSTGPAQTEPAEHLEPPSDLSAFLEGIGVPEPRPFVPDAWQEEALAHLAATDVIVSVPTGSGKTYVAIEATRRAIETDRTVIYTSPLKALSNTKFTEFSRLFGSDRVGILTGDRKDNPQAPLLIMTTEILRNLLYDAAGGEIDVRLDTLGLVIMDESQYIADPERGVVWEETIIFCPTQARLLLLSASIGNPQEVAEWLTSIRPTPCHLVRHQRRSVPLRAGYLHPSGKLSPLFRTVEIPRSHGAPLHPETKRLFAQYEEETLRPNR